jgi:type IV pilus assembly protein PilY1
MKKIQILACALVAFFLCWSASLHAEDIDIYVSDASTVGTPNVLFVIDNAADFSSNDTNFNCTLYDGTIPNLNNSAGGVEQCALLSMLNGLTNGTVNIGILLGNANGFLTDSRNPSDDAYHETCQGTYGGCVARKLALMDATGRASLMKFIKDWTTSAPSSAGAANIKSSTGRTANMMQEAWAYYNGKVGMSTKNYASSILTAGCQRNFIVFIGNSASASGGPADGGAESPYNGTNALTSTQVGATTAQLSKITDSVTFTSTTCGDTSRTAGTNASDWSENWADEWARLMYQKDGGSSGNFGTQNIITYTIGVVDEQKNCKSDYPALLSSMAKFGGGKYYKATSVDDLKNALDAILNEVQAVNSVFSSASLPVSVNAQGTYLNQIYLGMFRPDATGSPRWLGNLKQYKLVYDNSGNLVLGDKNGNSAISASGTGFLSPTAVSFWTSKDTTAAPDNITNSGYSGFFSKNPEGTPINGFDSPDGEVVEKGGMAQQLRKENLTATFAGASNTSVNPRRMYTYCPTESSCNTDLTNTVNDFSVSNADISTSAFGTSSTVGIASITRSGTTATVTTSGVHGFSNGSTVTISNVTQNDYNGDKVIAVTGTNTFTYTVPEYPTTPAAATYTLSKSAASYTITSVTRPGTGSGNSETATITLSATPSLLSSGQTVTVSNVSDASWNGSYAISSITGNTLSVSSNVYPVTPALNAFTVKLSSASAQTISKITFSSGTATVTTSAAHPFHTGQTVVITAGSGGNKITGTSYVITKTSSTGFTFTYAGSYSTMTSGTATASTGTVPITAANLTRTGTGSSATANVTLAATYANWFSTSNSVTVAATVSGQNDSGYAKTATITCVITDCTQFTYSVSTTPSLSSSGGTVSTSSASATANSVTRTLGSGTVSVTLPNSSANKFATNDLVNVVASSNAQANESAYTGSYLVTCTNANCTTLTYGPVTLTPTSPASGGNMQAYSGSAAPDRNTVIKWLRGQDNFGDELGPGSSVTVRPSVHADVLHSRPLVINYGDSRGIVVYYGSNDGVFHAANGNQTGAIGTVPVGGELWGLVLTDHYSTINRQRVASPEVKFPSTTLSTATAKDYFVDGPTGAYQKLNADSTVNKAYIFLTMRRGGHFMYALDVSTPAAPKVLWKIDAATSGFSQLGQTWSRPRVTLLQSSTYKTTPVLVFGGGYDPAEDSEPPATDTLGRGIFIVNAETGALIWRATATCAASATCYPVPTMTNAIPSEIAFVDRDGDGYIDKLYFGDLGGNIWRADVADASTSNWKVTKIAALGCDTGTCASGTTPRKFFFPPTVLSIKAPGATGSYDAIGIESGDREHPLKNTATGSAYNTVDRFFLVKDLTTTVNPTSFTTTDVTVAGLSNATSTKWDGSGSGFYITFATGEKGVNAPLAVNGFIFFSTNQPSPPEATCAANLGTARAYAVSPFTSDLASNVLSGGGLPPSPVAGLVSVTTTNADGSTTTKEEKFCIGCGMAALPGGATPPPTCTGNAALQNCTPVVNVTGTIKRSYWYKK